MPQRSRITKFLLRYMPEGQPASPYVGISVGLGASILASALRFAIDPFVEGVPFVTYFPLIALASIFGGLWGGLTALVVSAVLSLFLWLPPRGILGLDNTVFPSILAFILSGGIVVAGFWALEEVVAALRRSEERSLLVASEMQHRVKNVLQLVLSISSITARDATTALDLQTRLNARVEALARVSDARSSSFDTLDLKELLSRLLEPFDHSRIRLRGAPIPIPATTASMLGLAVHELATNAVKYGALSLPSGTIDISWKSFDGFVVLRWREKGGPLVTKPTKKGFGSKLLESVFNDDNGTARLRYSPRGLRCVLAAQVATP
jgi:two-component sensor histidine kinase